MPKAKNGDTVKIHYTGKLEDGTVFDSSTDRDPIQFTIGENQVITGVEQEVIGMNPGESKTINVPADKAYGPYNNELIMVVDRKEIPENLQLKIGQHLRIPQADNKSFIVRVTEISNENVTFDGNHPLAGKELTFDIELLEIC